MTVFGSFARGFATAGSDIDVVIVRPANVAADSEKWIDSVASFVDRAATFAGNPVADIHLAEDELTDLAGRSLWEDVLREGTTLAGRPLAGLVRLGA